MFLQFAPLSFDASTLEIWGPLANGGCLAVLPAGAPTVSEAKEVADYRLAAARKEIAEARDNRGADHGVFVFSRVTAPPELPSFQRLGPDLFVVLGPNDPAGALAPAALARRRARRAA